MAATRLAARFVQTQRKLALYGMLHHWRWILFADNEMQSLLPLRRHLPGGMDFLVITGGQFGDVFADKLTGAVKFLGLRDGVEYPEPGLRIATGGGRPLPATIIGTQVKIDQFLRKVALTPAPIYQ